MIFFPNTGGLFCVTMNTNLTLNSMKITVTEGLEKPFLTDGRHEVTITQIDEGKSEYKKVPFLACRMENETGFVTQRFYTSPAGMPILMALCQAANVPVDPAKELDTNDLLNKKVSVDVSDYTYPDPDSGLERTIKQATAFEPTGHKGA